MYGVGKISWWLWRPILYFCGKLFLILSEKCISISCPEPQWYTVCISTMCECDISIFQLNNTGVYCVWSALVGTLASNTIMSLWGKMLRIRKYWWPVINYGMCRMCFKNFCRIPLIFNVTAKSCIFIIMWSQVQEVINFPQCVTKKWTQLFQGLDEKIVNTLTSVQLICRWS